MLYSEILSVSVCFNSSKTNGHTSIKLGTIGHQYGVSVRGFVTSQLKIIFIKFASLDRGRPYLGLTKSSYNI